MLHEYSIMYLVFSVMYGIDCILQLVYLFFMLRFWELIGLNNIVEDPNMCIGKNFDTILSEFCWRCFPTTMWGILLIE